MGWELVNGNYQYVDDEPEMDPNQMQALPAGDSHGGELSQLAGAGKTAYGVGKDVIQIGSKFGKFGGIASKLKSATPYGIAGTAANIAGNLIGKHNYRTGGALAGAGSGAAMGATIGSVIPVFGTAAGAIVGGLIGGIKGFFGGKKRKEEQHKIDLARNDEYEKGANAFLQKKYSDPNFVPTTKAEKDLMAASPEDRANIIRSWGNRDAVEAWGRGGGNLTPEEIARTKVSVQNALPQGYSIGPYGEQMQAPPAASAKMSGPPAGFKYGNYTADVDYGYGKK